MGCGRGPRQSVWGCGVGCTGLSGLGWAGAGSENDAIHHQQSQSHAAGTPRPVLSAGLPPACCLSAVFVVLAYMAQTMAEEENGSENDDSLNGRAVLRSLMVCGVFDAGSG